MMFNDPSHFFPKAKAVILQVQRIIASNFSPWGSVFTFGLSDQESRKLDERPRSDRLVLQRGARMPGQRRAGQLIGRTSLIKRLPVEHAEYCDFAYWQARLLGAFLPVT